MFTPITLFYLHLPITKKSIMASVTTVFRSDKLNKKKEAPIHFRIIKDRKISYISSGIIIPEEHWDEKNKKIKAKHPNSARANSLLSNKYTDLQDQVLEFETIHKGLTSRSFRVNVYGKKPFDVFPFADEVVAEYLAQDKIGSYDKNLSIIAKLKEYTEGRNICFQDITPDFLTKYEKYLKEKKGNKVNTIHKDFKFIRKVFNDAYRKDVIDHSVIPFNKYKMKTERTEKVYLSEEELTRIETVTTTKGTRLELHRDMFIFASYVGGLRVSDVLQMKWKHFDGTNIHVTIQKTGNQLSIKVPNKAIEFIEKYKPKKKNLNAFIFPILPIDTDLTDPRTVDTAISRATAYINKNLKFLAAKAEIDKHISFHTSRHTWATRALRKGMSIDKVSKLMGHAAIRETQVYAKIVSSELDKAMDIFND
jgi:site-specific recombinase XerD